MLPQYLPREQQFFSQQSQLIRAQLKRFEGQQDNENGDLNIMILGPCALIKQSLIRTFCQAYHNKPMESNPQSPSDGWIRKTPLTNHKKYVVEGYNCKQLQRRTVCFEEYCQAVNSKTIDKFSKLYSSLLPNVLLAPTCGSSAQRSLARSCHKTTVLVLESGANMCENEYIYLGMLLSNLQEQELRPIIVLANLREQVKWLSEKQALDRKEAQVKRVSNGFNIPRDQIYLLQCYPQGCTSLSEQLNFYALQVLFEVVRQADRNSKRKMPAISFGAFGCSN